jgi:hypothetical protein
MWIPAFAGMTKHTTVIPAKAGIHVVLSNASELPGWLVIQTQRHQTTETRNFLDSLLCLCAFVFSSIT